MTASQAMAGKRVLVFGGHLRLGRAVALDLASQGAAVSLTCRNSVVDAQATVAQIEAAGGRADWHRCDLTDHAAVAATVAAVAAAGSGLDAVVVCAASYRQSAPDPIAGTDAPAILHENAWGPVQAVLAAHAALRVSADGRAVLLGDLAGVRPYRGYLAHSMAKAALHHAVAGLAVELAPEVVVNGVAPGAVLRPADHPQDAWNRLQHSNPLGAAALADPQLPVRAVCAAVSFFLNCPRFVTGQVLAIDGGRTARW